MVRKVELDLDDLWITLRMEIIDLMGEYDETGDGYYLGKVSGYIDVYDIIRRRYDVKDKKEE